MIDDDDRRQETRRELDPRSERYVRPVSRRHGSCHGLHRPQAHHISDTGTISGASSSTQYSLISLTLVVWHSNIDTPVPFVFQHLDP
jgi:hypothetical protein